MTLKIMGACFIIAACGALGFRIAAAHRREVKTLRELICALDFMECELQFRMTALPELCRQTSRETKGVLNRVFSLLANELEDQISPDVRSCMGAATAKVRDIPGKTLESLRLLGDCLGRFDLMGQLKGLDTVRQECRVKLNSLMGNSEARVRSYQTLGLCAGAALVILLM